ncbi:CHAT domain-containing protein [Candidatus Gracilibacteria bacterium]|nr:CHAT domain-containing protein [Candidatus Gracilibacteria bacterium]NJM86747.1 CHAT domain-containing protein [Hydrococcus sp. RU_2_2]NJP18351.1 CHAT domain-containing protein [Hydrococcus sp. CRU_1_1]
MLLPIQAQQPIQNQSSALSLVRTGQKYYDTGQFSEAIKVLEQAAKVYEAQGDILKQAQTLSWMSLAQQKLGRTQEAQDTINLSVSLLETAPQTKERVSVFARVLNNQGLLLLSRGQAENALETWQEAEKLYTQLNDRIGITGNQINQAQALETLGFYRRSCNTVIKAFKIENLKCEELASESLNSVLKTLQTQPKSLQVLGLRSFGNVLRLLGKLNESQTILEQSLTIAQALNSPLDESKSLLALGNTQQAFTNRTKDLKQTDLTQISALKAINYYRQATAIANSPNHSLTTLQAQLNELSLLIELEKWSEIEELLRSLQGQMDNLPASRTSVYLKVNFARNLANLKERQQNHLFSWQEIGNMFNLAAEQAKSIKDKRAESYALGYLGQLGYMHKLSILSTPQALLERSLALAQTVNAPEIAYRWQWELGRIYRDRGEKERAIAAYQAAFDTLQILRGDLMVLNQEIQFSFREQVEPVYREFAELLLESQPSQADLKKARLAIEALQIAELDNYFQDACANPKENIERVDPQAAVIYTAILPKRLEVIFSRPDGTLKLYTNTVSQAEVENTLLRLQNALREPDRLREVKALSQQVYRWLIAPFEEELDGKIQTLVFVLDGVLQNIPIAVLYNGKQYLVERYATAVTPGLRLFGSKPFSRPFEALVTGISEERRIREQDFTALNYVQNEWKAIQSIAPSKALFNAKFTKTNFEEELNTRPFSVVHIATHGQFSSDPEGTFILLWDRVLNVRDLDNLLQPRNRLESEIVDLLVLSACETAAGDKRASLGLAGVAVRTGARSTLATLWQVNDESTAALMSLFYQKLSENPAIAKAEALRQAQLELWKNITQDWQVPFFWASYVLVGNWL